LLSLLSEHAQIIRKKWFRIFLSHFLVGHQAVSFMLFNYILQI
jgi:hypothetical protein